MIWALCLANNTPEAHRKKEGDIIDTRPADWRWGTRERMGFLVVLVGSGGLLSSQADAVKLTAPLFGDGEVWWPEGEPPEVIGKRRYAVPFARLDVLARAQGLLVDWGRVRDEKQDYQPFLDSGVVLPLATLIDNKASGLRLSLEDIGRIADYGKFETITN